MQTTDSLNIRLTMCNAQYKALIDLMHQLVGRIDTDHPMVLRESLKELETMQTEANRLDILLYDRVEIEGLDRIPEASLAVRKDMLKQIAKLNGLLVEKLEGKMSVMNHEIEINRKSRRAMTGYRTIQDHCGNIVQKSS